MTRATCAYYLNNIGGLPMDAYYGIKQHVYDPTKNLIRKWSTK